MIAYLTNQASIKAAVERINELIQLHGEWLCVCGSRASTLKKSDCDFRLDHGRLIFFLRAEDGTRLWSVTGWERKGDRLRLEVSRRMGAEKRGLEFIPRASARAMKALLGTMRRERCRLLAELACGLIRGSKVERAGLSTGSGPGQPGAFARIILRQARERIGVAGIVGDSDGENLDAFLASTLIWFTRACERARQRFIQRLWLMVEGNLVEPLAERLALLRDDLRQTITLFALDDEGRELTRAELPGLTDLLARKRPRLKGPAMKPLPSESAERIIALRPEAIDVIRSRHGETLRFHGLAFARVRRWMGSERVWFGVESGRRKLFEEATKEDWIKLIEDLSTYRAEGADHGHALYRAAPEAWLESLLRRDITQLDPGLRLAPLYAQFRPSRPATGGSRPIDLLALRHDGRLAVIELKVSEDREHVLQGAAYYLEVEAHRRAGNVGRARLFGDALIADEPTLVYLVAPILRSHRAFETLAHSISPEIELYRFDINEDWRAGVRVLRRSRAN